MGRRRDYDEGYDDARRDMMERETGAEAAAAPLPPPSLSNMPLSLLSTSSSPTWCYVSSASSRERFRAGQHFSISALQHFAAEIQAVRTGASRSAPTGGWGSVFRKGPSHVRGHEDYVAGVVYEGVWDDHCPVDLPEALAFVELDGARVLLED